MVTEWTPRAISTVAEDQVNCKTVFFVPGLLSILQDLTMSQVMLAAEAGSKRH